MPRPCCCDPTPTPYACSATGTRCTANDDLIPFSVIVTLPSISTAASGRFTTSGGDFLCDIFHASGHPDGAGDMLVSGAFRHECILFGASLGTDCGKIVRPYVSFRDTLTGNRFWIGYSVETTSGNAGSLRRYAMESPGTVSYPMADCLSFDETRTQAAVSTTIDPCGGGAFVAYDIGAVTLRART